MTIAEKVIRQLGANEWEITYPASKEGIAYRTLHKDNPIGPGLRNRYTVTCTYLFNAIAGQMSERPSTPPPF
jgi:hypothetical protein